MKFNVTNQKGKVIELDVEYPTAYAGGTDDRLRLITACIIWNGTKPVGCGIAIKHPSDFDGAKGERVAFNKALRDMDFTWLCRNHLTMPDIYQGWKRQRSKEWQDANRNRAE